MLPSISYKNAQEQIAENLVQWESAFPVGR